jgi:hypothetical protein
VPSVPRGAGGIFVPHPLKLPAPPGTARWELAHFGMFTAKEEERAEEDYELGKSSPPAAPP